MTDQERRRLRFEVSAERSDLRIDQILAEGISELSRSSAARLIREERVSIDGATVTRPSQRASTGALIEVEIPEPEPTDVIPQDIPLSIIWQDEHLAIVDKPAGLVVHPAAGHRDGTLVNALLHHLDDLSGIGGEIRPGIVHRLDRDTSGLLVVAKNDETHRLLSDAWNTEAIRKFYLALVYGIPSPPSGSIEAPIGRHPKDRKKMAIVKGGKPALTLYRVVEEREGHALVELELKTGRTHQIRVHMQSIGHPIVGDPVYGGAQWKGIQDRAIRDRLRSLDRQALHAARLEIIHPITGERLTFESPMPEELKPER